MVQPIDIAEAIHKMCVEDFIPNKVSLDHDIDGHVHTTGYYARVINEVGLDVTGDQVIQAIFDVTNWDKKSPWPGHPHPDLVIAKLKLDL